MDKILLIEDDPEIAQFVQLFLEQKKYLVISVNTGESALRYLDDIEKPQLIICDIGLPDVNGLEICKKIRNNMKLRKIPIIVLTGRTDNASRITAGEDGANLYLNKPISSDDLLKAVENLIQKYKEEQNILQNLHIKKFKF